MRSLDEVLRECGLKRLKIGCVLDLDRVILDGCKHAAGIIGLDAANKGEMICKGLVSCIVIGRSAAGCNQFAQTLIDEGRKNEAIAALQAEGRISGPRL